MWNDRFLFVASAIIAMASVVFLKYRKPESEKVLKIGSLTVTVYSSVLLAGIALIATLVAGRLWLYWDTPVIPNAGNLMTILFGAAFGTFTARFVLGLFRPRFVRDPIIGAGVLALLSIVYSLPLYSNAISDFLSRTGLSTVKTPFLELSLRERGSKSYTASAGNQINLGGVPRSSSPATGLQWLSLDTETDFTPDEPTFPMDKEYIGFFEKKIANNNTYTETLKDISKFLSQARILSKCLDVYVKSIPDSALLVVDVTPVLVELFRAHRTMKDRSHGNKNADSTKINIDFSTAVQKVIDNVNTNFPGACKKADNLSKYVIDISYNQPYTTLVLADLVYARGARDEAIEILAEWLTQHSPPRNQKIVEPRNQKIAEGVAAWWRLRVMSRIALWMAEVAGQNNSAYQTFINGYKMNLEEYYKGEKVSLDNLHSRCNAWNKEISAAKASAPGSIAGEQSVASKQGNHIVDGRLIEQKAFYQLLAAEDESLRTELNFIGEITDISKLEYLLHRAAFLGEFGVECLPNNFDERENIINDHKVTIGVLGLTLADRMHALAQSRGDHERANDIASEAVKKYLRPAYIELRERVRTKRDLIKPAIVAAGSCKGCEDWTTRIFEQSPWEKSTNLAERYMMRLGAQE